jgi:long-chain-alcohol oxidase
VLLRDRDGGEVRGERPAVRYPLSAYDAAHLEHGLEGAVQILHAAGARRVVTSRGRRSLILYSFHQMGTARMGASPELSACDWDGALWDAPQVVVCDGSTFPTASGVNPMVTISAVAHMNARALASRV